MIAVGDTSKLEIAGPRLPTMGVCAMPSTWTGLEYAAAVATIWSREPKVQAEAEVDVSVIMGHTRKRYGQESSSWMGKIRFPAARRSHPR